MNLVRGALRLLLWLACLAAGAVALYFLARLLWAYWLPIAVCGFLLVGTFFAVALVVRYVSIWRQPGLESTEIAVRWAAASGFGKVRLVALLLADALIIVTGGWANGVLHMLLNRRTVYAFGGQLRQNVAFSRLGGVAARQAPVILVFVLGSVAAAALLESSWVNRGWLRAFLVVLMLNIALRHFVYTASDESLPTMLRRSAGSPWIAFVFIAVCDALSYLLILDTLLHWVGPSALPLAPLREIAKAFFLGSIMDVVKVFLDGGQPRPDTLLIAGLSALYGAAGLRSITKLKDFDRTDEDHAAIAQTYAVLGRYLEALTAAERIRKPFSAGRLLRAAVMVGLSRFDQAQADLRAAYGLAGREVTPREAYSGLFMACAPYRYATESYNEIIRIGIAADLPDTYVFAALITFQGNSNRFTLPAAQPVFSDPPTAAAYPLSAAMVLLAGRDRDRAIGILAASQQTQPIETLLAECLRAGLRAADPATTLEEDRAAFDVWSHAALGSFAKVAATEFDAIEHLAASAQLLAVLGLAIGLHSQHEQAWRYLVAEFSRPLAAKLAAADLSAPDAAVLGKVLEQQQRAAVATIGTGMR